MISKAKEIFNDMSLLKKLTIVFTVVLLSLYLLAMGALWILFGVYDRHLYEKSQQELDFFVQEIDGDLDQIENLSMEIATNDQIQEQIRKMYSKEYLSQEFNYEKEILHEMFQNKIISEDLVRTLIYTDGKDVNMTVGTDSGVISEEVKETLLTQAEDARGAYVSLAPTEEYPYLLGARNIREIGNASLEYMGSLIFVVDTAGILAKKADNLQAEHSNLYVYSESGPVYEENEANLQKFYNEEENEGYKISKYNGERFFVCYEKSPKNEWMYVNEFPYSEIFGQVLVLRNILTAGFIIMLIFCIYIVRRVTRTITNPLEKLSESMKIVENGDFEAAKNMLPEKNSKNEVGTLTREFRVMLERIDQLIYENYEKQILLRDTKYKMLQAQINPHFLYNTLNAINWMIRTGENQDASKMVIELGKLLRASFAKKPVTTVREELETVKSYITIQQFRYKNRAEFIVEESGNLEDYIMPRMILQPLVENAINYGVECMLSVCTVKISVYEEENRIHLVVYNQGPGMEEERLKQVQDGTAVPQGNGIGLKNITERLHMFFSDSEVNIESTVGEGTTVHISIEKKREGTLDV